MKSSVIFSAFHIAKAEANKSAEEKPEDHSQVKLQFVVRHHIPQIKMAIATPEPHPRRNPITRIAAPSCCVIPSLPNLLAAERAKVDNRGPTPNIGHGVIINGKL